MIRNSTKSSDGSATTHVFVTACSLRIFARVRCWWCFVDLAVGGSSIRLCSTCREAQFSRSKLLTFSLCSAIHKHTHTHIYIYIYMMRRSNPNRGKRLFSKTSRPAVGPTHPSHLMGTGVISWRSRSRSVKLNHSLPRSAEAKNEWSSTSTPPICLHGVYRGAFSCVHMWLRQTSLYFWRNLNDSLRVSCQPFISGPL